MIGDRSAGLEAVEAVDRVEHQGAASIDRVSRSELVHRPGEGTCSRVG